MLHYLSSLPPGHETCYPLYWRPRFAGLTEQHLPRRRGRVTAPLMPGGAARVCHIFRAIPLRQDFHVADARRRQHRVDALLALRHVAYVCMQRPAAALLRAAVRFLDATAAWNEAKERRAGRFIASARRAFLAERRALPALIPWRMPNSAVTRGRAAGALRRCSGILGVLFQGRGSPLLARHYCGSIKSGRAGGVALRRRMLPAGRHPAAGAWRAVTGVAEER